MLKHYSVLWFVFITVALSFAAYFLPLPVEQKSLLVPILLVLIPTVICVSIVLLTEGTLGIRQLFSTVRGAWKWSLIGAGGGALLRMAVLIALSVLLTWVYIRSGGSLLAVTLLHGIQNGLVVINRGLSMAESTWLLTGVYVLFAVLLVLFDRHTFFAKPSMH